MESGHVTTPFGRRSMSLGMLASQMTAREIEPGASIDKWKLYRSLCEARPLLGITDRALSVLNALLSFYPHNELAEDNGLIVFPSNAQLSLRAHGMAEQTIRRHLAALIETGLLVRKDSANGKRYAHKGRGGEISEAFGFSLAPLLARAAEIEGLAAEVVTDRLRLQRLRERLTVCRRDITKLIEAAIEEGVDGDWQAMIAMLKSILARLTRQPSTSQVEDVLDELDLLRQEILNTLEPQIKTTKQSANAHQNERHIQNSNPDSISELEPGFEAKLGAEGAEDHDRRAETAGAGRSDQAQLRAAAVTVPSLAADMKARAGLKSFPLGLVLQACPQIIDYGPAGAISSWRDLMKAAVVVRTMLGVSPSAFEEACSILGPENAATVVACILEKGGHVSSAGGYLRDLTRRAERDEFAIGPMLMALVRLNGPMARRTG
ncbi:MULTISPECIES: plasmid replication protein RepC [Rhizobium]|uniref:Replication initiation protein RepC n=1 Tax=Rhizobium hidalgonense TaxID=1538159 RepID=A0ABX4JQH2_9HYPH|nr:plasmid replication protein RepC [Rhizobium hidalgonense]PDT21841.1 replication initiation protein RepC [Rhizobium hidalgonense]PON08501.1 replication initiation protein RepC [Rhizobium hidalgonense]UWU39055.1 plasmid replication protein RepC [Rhizobium leguminosarum bv. phaseoli]